MMVVWMGVYFQQEIMTCRYIHTVTDCSQSADGKDQIHCASVQCGRVHGRKTCICSTDSFNLALHVPDTAAAPIAAAHQEQTN